MSQHVGGAPAPLLDVDHVDQIPDALRAAGLDTGRAVVVIVGGAKGMSDDDLRAVGAVMRSGLVPAIARHGAVVVDGGTDSGVMRLIGQARSATGAEFPLVGVAATGTVEIPGRETVSSDAAPLEPHHTLFVLVPGDEWGDEAPWIGHVAAALAGGQPSVTVLINGGQIAYSDAEHSIEQGRPLVILGGTGRTADAIAAAADPRAAEIAASELTTVVPVAEPGEMDKAVDAVLGGAVHREVNHR